MRRYSLQSIVTPGVDLLNSPVGWTSSVGAVSVGSSALSPVGPMLPIAYVGGVPSIGSAVIATTFGKGLILTPGVTYGYRIVAISSGAICDIALVQQPSGSFRNIFVSGVPANAQLNNIEGTFVASASDGPNPGLCLRPIAATSGTYGMYSAEIWQETSSPFQVG